MVAGNFRGKNEQKDEVTHLLPNVLGSALLQDLHQVQILVVEQVTTLDVVEHAQIQIL